MYTLNLNGQYTNLIDQTLKEQGIPYIELYETGYEPEYQGTLFILTTETPLSTDQIKHLKSLLNEGDDFYRITPTAKESTYLIDITQ